MKHSKEEQLRFKYAKYGILFMGVFAAYASIDMLIDSFFSTWEAIHSSRQLIVIDSSDAYLPGLSILGVLFAVLGIFSVIYATPKRIECEKSLRFIQRFVKSIGYLAILGGVVFVVGKIVLTNSWNDAAKKAGFERCPPFTLLISRPHHQAWTRDLKLCRDGEIAMIMSDGLGGPRTSFEVEKLLESRNELNHKN